MILTALLNGLLLVGLCVPGFLLQKFLKLSRENLKGIAIILTYVATSALAVYSFQCNFYTPELLGNMGWVTLFSLLGQVLMLIPAIIVFRKGYKKDADATLASIDRTYSVVSVFCNCGFMGIPFLRMLLPDKPEAILYASVYMAIFNVLVWSLGIYLLTGEKKYIQLKRILFNAPTAALFVALPLFFLKIRLPEILFTGVEYFANVATPLSMIIVGIYLAEMKPSVLLLDAKMYVATALKLIAAPMVMLLVALPFSSIIDNTLILVCFVIAAMPSASAPMLINEMYGTQAGSAAAVRGQLVSTLLSVLTIPFVIFIFNLIVPI